MGRPVLWTWKPWRRWRVAQIDFGDTQSEQLATLMQMMRVLWPDIYGNGQEGIKKKAEDFMAEANGAQKEQERQQRQNSLKLNWILLLCAIVTAIVTTVGLIVTIKVVKTGDLRDIISEHFPAYISQSHTNDATAGPTHF